MAATAPQPGFESANPHALAVILDASETKSIIACQDIYDIGGTKLWARNQPVSGELQRKLMDRRLRKPLETCLLAEDGVTAFTLLESLEAELGRDGPLQPVLKPHAARLLKELPYLPLHPVAQLLLTAAQASRQSSYEHAVQAMALAGALALAEGGSMHDVRLAMLCGLLHDLGEMYIDPHHGEADADRMLDVESYRALVVHPHVGQLLLAQLTDYPRVIARAVAEHHERLDGSGYPYRLEQAQVSRLGRLMAAVETALGVLRRDGATLESASVALRLIPSEHDMHWVGHLARCARQGSREPAAQIDAESLRARLQQLDVTLAEANLAVDAMRMATDDEDLAAALALGRHLLARMRAGWDDSGLWHPRCVGDDSLTEAGAIDAELRHRLAGIERAIRLRAGEDLLAEDEDALASLCRRWAPGG